MSVLALRESVPDVTAIVAGDEPVVTGAVVVAVHVDVGVVIVGRELAGTVRRLDEAKRGVGVGFVVTIIFVIIIVAIIIADDIIIIIVFAYTTAKSPAEV